MGDSFDKRARERRKQQKRQEKVARKRNRDPKAEAITEEMTPQDWFELDKDEPESAEDEDGAENEKDKE